MISSAASAACSMPSRGLYAPGRAGVVPPSRRETCLVVRDWSIGSLGVLDCAFDADALVLPPPPLSLRILALQYTWCVNRRACHPFLVTRRLGSAFDGVNPERSGVVVDGCLFPRFVHVEDMHSCILPESGPQVSA